MWVWEGAPAGGMGEHCKLMVAPSFSGRGGGGRHLTTANTLSTLG